MKVHLVPKKVHLVSKKVHLVLEGTPRFHEEYLVCESIHCLAGRYTLFLLTVCVFALVVGHTWLLVTCVGVSL